MIFFHSRPRERWPAPGSEVANTTRCFRSGSQVEGRASVQRPRRIPRDIPRIERSLIYRDWPRGYKQTGGRCSARQTEAKSKRKKRQREGVGGRRHDPDTDRTKGRSSDKEAMWNGKRKDVPQSYGPSTSRSNILANLCPIKINQTPLLVLRFRARVTTTTISLILAVLVDV